MNESPRPLSYAEQKAQGVYFPRANCPVCTVSYGLLENNTMRRHGPRYGPPCSGTHQVPDGLTKTETA